MNFEAYLLPYDMKQYFLYDTTDIDVFRLPMDFFPERLFDYKKLHENPYDNHMFSNANYMFHRCIENMDIHNDYQNDYVDNELQ